MRKLGVFISARLESSRLPEKHLLPVLGRPILSWLISRMAREFSSEIKPGSALIAVTTADTPRNRGFPQRVEAESVRFFWGAEDNIPLRHLEAMKEFGLDGCVAIDGDDVLCSTAAARNIWGALQGGAELAFTSGLPFGMNAFGYSRELLESALGGKGGGEVLETGWGRIFEPFESEKKILEMKLPLDPDNARQLRMTLDYEQDYLFFRDLMEEIGSGRILEAGDEEICRTALDGGHFRRNADLNEEYWRNFHRQVESEKY